MKIEEMSVDQIISNLDMLFDWKRRPHEGKFLQAAFDKLKEQQKTISELYDILEDICKDFRQTTGQDDVCGMCMYDGCAYKGEEDWCGYCPGFDSDECFVMGNKIRKMCGKELLPEGAYCEDD